MNIIRKIFGPSNADKTQALVNQMLKLEKYIADNGVEIVENDTRNPFVKCGDIKNEHAVRRDMNAQLVAHPNDPALKEQREELLRKEFFLKVGDQDKFVSLGNTDFLDFDQSNISTIIGLDTPSRDYKQQEQPGIQFMNNYLYSRTAPTTVNPEKDETNTLLKTLLRAAKKRTDEKKAKADEAYRLSQHKQRQGESDDDFRRRIFRIEEEKAHQDLIDPNNCSVNFRKYLVTKVDEISGTGERYRGKTIYEFLFASIGSTEGGFQERFRKKNILSDYSAVRQQMARFAQDQTVQQGFIDTLCENGNAREILAIVSSEDIEGGQSYYQTSSEYDPYSKNVWKALRLCLECLEEYILNKYKQQLPNVAIDQSPPPPPPPLVVGGKLKSRSKSIRKKRISHRKKKSHSHKRRALKRRAVN